MNEHNIIYISKIRGWLLYKSPLCLHPIVNIVYHSASLSARMLGKSFFFSATFFAEHKIRVQPRKDLPLLSVYYF